MSAPWVSGGRVSPRVLERQLGEALLTGARDVAATRVVRRCERIWRHAVETLGPASGAQAVWEHLVGPCAAALDWPTMAARVHAVSGLRVWTAVPTAGLEDAILVALPWGVDPKALHRPLVRLGADARRPWVSACNGRTWCWHDARRPYARDHLSIDLAHAATDGRVWQALWLLGQAWPTRNAPGRRTAWLDRLVIDSHADDSSEVAALRDIVQAGLTKLCGAVAGSRDDHVRQLFQWIFLLCAESRALVPSWHGPYRRSYSVSGLARESATGPALGVRDSASAIARLGREGGRIGVVDVAPLNGRLFEHTPVTRRGSSVPDEVVAGVLGELTGAARGPRAAAPIDFAHLRVEHLGGVYEHLMAPAEAASTPPLERKRAGAFYTPRPLADVLVHRALGPIVEDASATDILALRILDPAMGSGALLASALRYLVSAVEAAWVREGRGGPLDVPRDERDALPRRIAEQCLFGVDVDATAVQVARMSIWLLSLAPDRPLTWLDAHLRVGNSLIGTSPDVVLARAPVQGRTAPRADGQLTLFELSQWHHEAGRVGPLLAALAARPTNAPADAHDKSDALARLRSRADVVAWRRRADAWCGAAMDPLPPTAAHWRALNASTRGDPTNPLRQGRDTEARWLAYAAAQGCLHWPLEFPDVFDAGRGGFDVVIANPPWEMLRADLGSDGDRAARRGDIAPLLRFVGRSGTYRRISGHVNSYQLFVERMLQLVRPGGRVGFLLPGAVLGDHGATDLRRHLLDRI
ncbi:MAG TPA: N-6 DNA methylase, partial [Luteitalea sp.]|nr:N-6 DNA methylase [Luteitalea sp.]